MQHVFHQLGRAWRRTVFVTVGALLSTSAGLASQPAPPSREGFVDAGAGVRLFYRVVGTGRDTVIVLHGGPGFSMSYLEPDLAPLAVRHTLIYYDQRGTGRSTLVTDSSALDGKRFAEDLEAVRKRFAIQRVTLLGHSWGAGVAALYARAYPDRVGRLVIVDPIPATKAYFTQAFQQLDARRDSTMKRRVQRLREARLANPGDAAACRAYYSVWFLDYFRDTTTLQRSRGDFCAGSPESLRNKVQSVDRFTTASLGDWDWRPALASVRVPAVIIHGTNDFIPVESAREWMTALPNARLVLMDGAGHFPYLEVPDQFFAAVEQFLAPRSR